MFSVACFFTVHEHLLKESFNPKAVSKLMGHAKEIIIMDVYADNRGIIADAV